MIKIISKSLLIFLLVFSCQSKQTLEPEKTEPEIPTPKTTSLIQLSGDMGNSTKTTLNGFVTSWISSIDKIGVYSPQGLPSQGGTPGVKNSEYNANSTAFLSEFKGTMYWGSGTHTFYAYYPFKASNNNIDAAVVPVSLASVQTQTGNTKTHFGNLAFTVATPKSVEARDGSGPPVGLDFNHVFSFIEFKILLNSGVTNLRKIEFTTQADANLSLTSGTIDITQTLPESSSSYIITNPIGTKTITLNIDGDCVVTSNTATTATVLMAVLPGDHSASTYTATYYTDNGTFSDTRTGINIVRNNKYSFTTRVLDISTIDWTQSLVYDVMNNSTKVGEVTKEYLISSYGSTIDAQAITYYPQMSSTYSGYVDMTKGRVAKVLRNGSNFTYVESNDLSTSNQGIVNFSTSNNKLTFTASATAQPAINLIPYKEFGNYDNLSLVPKYLSDSRNYYQNGAIKSGPYNYKVLKVATQYWMGENLRTTQYRDNSNITELTDVTQWSTTTSGAFSRYNNNDANADTYGLLYNAFAVGYIKTEGGDYFNGELIVPNSWDTPTSMAWTTLEMYVGKGNPTFVGGKLKSITGWTAPNTGATDISGFTHIPGGYRSEDGIFAAIGEHASCWDSTYPTEWKVSYNTSQMPKTTGFSFNTGLSIRCVLATPWS